ncbi:MAG: ACT domain-containing protein [Gammaproteobacteria bacterium]|nr:ACT domain-containing protein [Gammaproteobacteria bacterium]
MNASNLKTVVITVFAEDKPGIVRTLSDTALSHNASWQESSLSRLCGQFTGIVHFEVTADKKSVLETSLINLSTQGIQVTVHKNTKIKDDSEDINGLYIMVEANDRPGIIREITQALAEHNVNVDNIDTEVSSASMAGYMLFKAHLALAMPDDMSESDLEEVLEEVSDDLMVSILEE